MARKNRGSELPSKHAILAFIKDSDGKATKRELARAFGIKGDARIAFKALLRDMADEGLIPAGRRKKKMDAHTLPQVAVLDIVDRDPDGELLARPARWEAEEAPPRIVVAPLDARHGPALGIGERILARLARVDDPSSVYGYEARPMRRLGHSAHKVLGVFRELANEGRVVPVDRKSRFELRIAATDRQEARSGDLVLVEVKGGAGPGLKSARVRERLGSLDDPRTISLIAVHMHGLRTEFSPAVEDEANRAEPVALGNRTDLRHLPLVTIDPADARDHDDAVFAEADRDPANPGGHVVIVAIADVAHYVTPGSALDIEARARGNSTYFPDRVIPMLPERLSNTLCSLEAGTDRACLAARLVFDKDGNKVSHRFMRALMRSAGSLSYEATQQAIEGRTDEQTAPLVETVIGPLHRAFQALDGARRRRGPLDLDLPEFRIEITAEGRIRAIAPRERLDAHRLIEEFMIAANVAAAETLESHRSAVMYRVHEPPAPEKLVALSDFLRTIDIKIPKGQGLTTKEFNRILERAQAQDIGPMVSEIVLRTQSQAYYGPGNRGHFGLNLRRYAHFTSPIRRYADLLVHRGLISALNFGPEGLTDKEISEFGTLGEEISAAERRSMAAERDATDRYVAAFMADQVGTSFAGRVTGVTRFGLFVRLAETGADGLIPIGVLGDEYFHHDDRAHTLVGGASGLTFRLGDPVIVELVEATPVTGGLRFALLEGGAKGEKPPRSQKGKHPRGKSRSRTKSVAKASQTGHRRAGRR